jgi:type IV secretion system protein VirD4
VDLKNQSISEHKKMNKRNTLVGPQLHRPSLSFHPDWKRLIAFAFVGLVGAITSTQMVAKPIALILPTLLSWKHSAFVTDLKGELYELTAGWRQKHARNKVLRFEPAAGTGSCCFNPMDELRLGTEHEVGDVQNLALLLVDPNCRGVERGDHWRKTAYSLLVGCILHLCYKSKLERTPATFAALDAMLADSSRPIDALWDEMLSYVHVNGRNHPVVSASARDMKDRPASEAGSVLSTAKTFLDLNRDPTVAKNTSRSDFKIRDLMHHSDPVSLYIVTQPNDKERLRPLVRIVVNMAVRLLADKMEFRKGRPQAAYKHKLLAMIDEFPALGKLEILQQSLAFVAGYAIKCYLIAQDINQLKSRKQAAGQTRRSLRIATFRPPSLQTDWKPRNTSRNSPGKQPSSKSRSRDQDVV